MIFLLGLCFLLSQDRKKINWRLVVFGLLFQASIGFLILKTDFRVLMQFVSALFVKILSFSDHGARILFGDLLDASV